MQVKSIGKKNQDGVATLEMLIALAVLTLSIAAVLLVVFGNQSVSADALMNQEALYKAQQGIENARASARLDFYSLASSTTTDDIYTRVISVKLIDDFSKKISSRVTWETPPRSQKIELTTVVADWNSALGGDTCSQTLSGDWTQPQLLGAADVGESSGATDVDVLAKKAYLTTDSTSVNKPDFYIVDVTDPSNPTLINNAFLHTGPGLAALHVAGKYAYVANTSNAASSGQLQIIDISNPSGLSVVKTFRLTNIVASGSQGLGKSIFYLNKKVYLGITKPASGPDFHVIDVSTPSAPVYLGGYTIGTTINDIYVKNNIAYVATPAPQGSSAKEHLTLLDVSNPANISSLSTFSAPNTAILNGNSLYLSGTTVYLGRSEETNNNGHYPDLFVLDASNPASLTQLGSKYIGSGINAITVRSHLAFMVTSDPNLGFQIWDLNTLTLYGSKNIQQTATGGMDCDGNLMYVAQRSNKALQIIGSQ